MGRQGSYQKGASFKKKCQLPAQQKRVKSIDSAAGKPREGRHCRSIYHFAGKRLDAPQDKTARCVGMISSGDDSLSMPDIIDVAQDLEDEEWSAHAEADEQPQEEAGRMQLTSLVENSAAHSILHSSPHNNGRLSGATLGKAKFLGKWRGERGGGAWSFFSALRS